MKNKNTWIVVWCLLCLSSCYPQSKKLQTISLGMTKEAITSRMGNPRAVRGSIVNESGQAVDLWEYRMSMPNYFWTDEVRDYWLYFVDGTLSKWGEAGDWQVEKDKIYSIRFNTAPSAIR